MLHTELLNYFKLLDTLPNPITFNELAYDEEGKAYDKILYVNQSFIDTIGYTTEEIPDDRVWFTRAYPNPSYQDYIISEWFNAVKKAQLEGIDLTGFPAKVRCKNGEDRWFNITTQLEHTIFEKYRTIVFIETDTPQKAKLDLDEKSLELINERRLLKTIIDSAPIRIFWKDLQGVYLGCNKAFLGDAQLRDESDIIGKTDFDMVWKKDAKRFIKDDKEVTDSGKAKLNYIEAQPQENGRDLVLSTSKVVLNDSSNRTIGVLGIYQDITEEYHAKEKLKESEELMIVQSRQAAMGEMLSMIAHQWKQPLSSISSIVAGIRVKQALTKLSFSEAEEKLIDIDKQILYLSQTITDFSDFFKPDEGVETVRLHEPIEKAILIIGKLLTNNDITLTTSYEEGIELVTYATELQQVCINIIKNAADAFMSKPDLSIRRSIAIKTYTKEDKAYIEISDNAGGLKEDILEKVFQAYFSTKSEKNGTGLGLYMSKAIITNHMKGTLSCFNREGGAVFTIMIPL